MWLLLCILCSFIIIVVCLLLLSLLCNLFIIRVKFIMIIVIVLASFTSQGGSVLNSIIIVW